MFKYLSNAYFVIATPTPGKSRLKGPYRVVQVGSFMVICGSRGLGCTRHFAELWNGNKPLLVTERGRTSLRVEVRLWQGKFAGFRWFQNKGYKPRFKRRFKRGCEVAGMWPNGYFKQLEVTRDFRAATN